MDCPKCGTEMEFHPYSVGLPGYVDPKTQKKIEGVKAPAISVTTALPLRVSACPKCHYVELWVDTA
jgi:ribosomal protein S27AE